MNDPAAERTAPEQKHSPTRKAAGWAVHALTASGAILGLLAMLAVIRGDARTALLWLGVALAVDGLDGPIARKLRVRDLIPRVDGAVLDLVVDYLTYVLVPAIFIYWFGLLPDGWGLPGAGFVLLTSLYCFANVDMKTSDNYFVGFPAIWNVVVLYMWLLGSPTWVNAAVVLALGVLTFVPVKFVHPIRVRDGRDITYASMLVWTFSALGLLLMSPASPWWLLAPWLASSAWLGFVSLRRTLHGPL
ncbi:MAG: phosphatidylcholine/phosphatidylserine synthase [Alphaproteobacteria bacterium]|nr:phosphatidylcholine/phosphatidylserine synthase [Alphaproteobacteria bacterium]